mmetsp:Transcript_67369/g.135305  ORF Transcript_67369/g.135305 Transcript_67369/m.135305 type:complete len:231 (+) Transcript_67369:439-1131(+)
MRPHHQIEIMLLEKLLDDIWTEQERDATIVLGPAGHVLVWVRPQKVANHAAVRHVRRALDLLELLHALQLWGQPAVHTEDLVVDNCNIWEFVEDLTKRLPQLDVVAPLALVVEAVDAGDGGALVVATKHEEVLRMLHLVRQEQNDDFEGLGPTVDVVAQEEVVGLRGNPAVLEEAQEVVKLSVDVPDDVDGCLQVEHGVLRHEDIAGELAYLLYLGLRRKLDLHLGLHGP